MPHLLSLCILLLSPTYFSAQENNINYALDYIEQARDYYNTEDYEKSLLYYNKAKQIAKKLQNDSVLSFVYAKISHIHLRNGKNKDAFDACSKAMDINERIGNVEKEIIANSGFVILLKRMNRLDKALEVALRSLKAIPKTKYYNQRNHVSILIVTSEVYIDKEQYDSVLYYTDKGLAISKSIGFQEGILDLYIKKGMVYYYQKQYDASLNYLLKAKDILANEKIKNRTYPKIKSNYFIGSCYYEQGLYHKAIDILVGSINNFEQNDLFKPPAIRSHLLLANCYQEKKEYQKANFWHSKYAELNASYQKDKDQTVDVIHEKETSKLQAKIANFRAEKIEDKKIQRNIFWILISISVALIAIVFMYIKKQRYNKRLFNTLLNEINLLESTKQTTTIKKESTYELSIDEDKVQNIIKGLEKLEMQEYFLKSECNLRAMAKKLKTNATYLSKIINIHKEKNFTDYINDLRIEYVLQRLKNDKKFRSYAIQSIASEVGYKSSYSLVKHFKAKTGINPSYYIKSLEKQQADSELIT
ncbi:helix-turn-helix domain-containing protein [Aquimarina sp. M1]